MDYISWILALMFATTSFSFPDHNLTISDDNVTELMTSTEPIPQITHCATPNVTSDNGPFLGYYTTTIGSIGRYYCRLGYNLKGDDSTICLNTGLWEKKPTTCVPVDCGKAMVPNYGTAHVSDGTTVYSKVTFSCNHGYSIVGNSTATCLASGQWSNASPICELIDCGSIKTPEHGEAHAPNGTTFNNTVVYFCNHGYNLVGNASSTCLASGNWSNTGTSCEPVDCGNITIPEHGEAHSPIVTTFNNTVVFSCSHGYNLAGNASSTCLASGNWSNTGTSCEPVECDIPENPAHGSIRIHGVTYGQSVKYLCDDGYQLIGNNTITCLSTGRWSNDPPLCSNYNSSTDTGDDGTDDNLFTDGFARSLMYGGLAIIGAVVLSVIITSTVLYCRREGIVCVCQIKTARKRQLIKNSLYSADSVELSTSRSNLSGHRRRRDHDQYEEITSSNKNAGKHHQQPSAESTSLGEKHEDDTTKHDYENDREMEEYGEIKEVDEHQYEMPKELRSFKGGEKVVSQESDHYLHPIEEIQSQADTKQ